MQSEIQQRSQASNQDLLQRVERFLNSRGYFPHRSLELEVEHGTVLVHGRVPSFYMRQIALECIKRVAGVVRVIDKISVEDPAAKPLSNNGSENALTLRRHTIPC